MNCNNCENKDYHKYAIAIKATGLGDAIPENVLSIIDNPIYSNSQCKLTSQFSIDGKECCIELCSEILDINQVKTLWGLDTFEVKTSTEISEYKALILTNWRATTTK